MAKIEIYTTQNCPYCMAAKKLLTELGQKYQEIAVDKDDEMRQKIMTLSGQRTVPQIFINGQSIGGFDELSALHKSGELLNLLEEKE